MLTSLGRWLAPWHRARGLNYLHYVLLVVVLNGAILAQRAGVIASLQQGFLSEQPSCQSFWPVPSGCLFGIHNSGSTIQSGFAGDDGLLDGETPTGDYDYMLGYAVQDRVSLPGGSWNHYTYLGAVYIYGSGWAMKFQTPWGSHFAFLHIASIYLTGWTAHGGQVVGLSGWPSSLQYSNGYCYDSISCRADAHLCLVLGDGARAWFFYVASGHDTAPAPKRVHHAAFPATRWSQYRRAHHKYVIPFRDHHGRLTWAASVWQHHARRLGGITRHEQWFGRTRHRRHGFTRVSFQGGAIFTHPFSHTTTIQYSKHWIR